MAILTPTQLKTLDTSFQGLPYCDISLIGSTTSLDYSFQGFPLVVSSDSESYFCKIKIGSAWLNVSEVYILIQGSWKTVSNLYANIAGSWKTHS